MALSLKNVARSVAQRLGYDVHRHRPGAAPGLAWLDAPLAGEQGIPTEGFQLANRSFQPKTLRYQRSRFGDDHRLKYILYFLDVRGLRTLELGPLSGYHSIMLEKLGVAENIAVEGRLENVRACVDVKERYQLQRTTFLHQNIEELYSGKQAAQFDGTFDLVFCLGVLYHLPDPGRAIEWCRTQAPRLFLSTHYVEPAELLRYPNDRFVDVTYCHANRSFRAKAFREGDENDPLSGLSPTSMWLTENDLLSLLHLAGYRRVHLLGRDLQNALPNITLLADAE
ncbi:MAG: class I SAM-dependent methyltransferase [Vicinamibacterales bacterium]